MTISNFFPIYCESGGTINSGPLNIISNLSFFIAALYLYFLMKEKKIKSLKFNLAIISLIILGIASTLSHINRIPTTFVFDALSIILIVFVLTFILFDFLIKNKIRSFIYTLGLAISVAILSLILSYENANVSYAILLILYVIIFGFIRIKIGNKFNLAIFGFASIGAALIFRYLDMILCDYIPFGTFFLWHLLAGLGFYLIIRNLINLESNPHSITRLPAGAFWRLNL